MSEELERALSGIHGVSKFLSRREIAALPKILLPGEIPEKAIAGSYNKANGLLVATNRRLLFIDKGLFALKVKDFPYDRIASIEYSTGMLFGDITIYASGSRETIDNCLKEGVQAFAEFVRSRIGSGSQVAAAAAPAIDPTVQLERLAKLKEAGHLSEDEYQAQKRKLLGL